MKEKSICLILLTLCGFANAQMGIGTNDPKRDLDVEGNVRIRVLENKSEDYSYDKILVVNKDGFVDYVNKTDLRPIGDEFTSDKQVLNNTYTTTDGKADESKYVSCGKFDFAFINNGNNTNIKFRLKTAPTGTNKITVYTTLEQNWQASSPNDTNGGYEFQSPTSGREFDSTNAYIDLPTSGAQIVNSELNVLHLLYPGEQDMYRLTFYRIDQSTSPLTYDFVTACEKF